MIPEREREALMRLTMCARRECRICMYQKRCDFDFRCELATKNMNILADALIAEQTEPQTCEDCKHWNDTEDGCADRHGCKTEPQTTNYCDVCNHKGCDNCVADGSNPYCVPSRYEPKTEPQSKGELIRIEDAIQAIKAYLDLCCLTEAKFHKGFEDYNGEIAREIISGIAEPNCSEIPNNCEPQTEEWYTYQDEQEYNARHGKE